MNYIFVLFVNMFVLALYYKIAVQYNIIDQPNERSSHKHATIRGAGVIFLVTGILSIYSDLNHNYYFFIGLISIGLISLLDDIFTLSVVLRIIVQSLSVLFALGNLGLLSSPVIIIGIYLILFLGWINAFNFMDGINGMTAFYSLSIFGTLYLVNKFFILPHYELIINICLSILVFMYVNVRNRALAFGGDVGSVVLAYMIGFLVLESIILSGHYVFILFGCVYGIDAIFTIFRRILGHQNIFLPHRSHLYQLLVNELDWNFKTISALYSIVQLIVNFVILFSVIIIPEYAIIVSIAILLSLCICYLLSLTLVLRNIEKKTIA
jgi:UDP-GlcNAc:undecaprenyl-phosphate/decaprenyl-phosphate GlcNAc-1-phosphate transferase